MKARRRPSACCVAQVLPLFGIRLATFERIQGCRDREAHVKTCPDCNGDGVIEKGTDDEQQCPTCGGSGVVPDDENGNEEVTRTAS